MEEIQIIQDADGKVAPKPLQFGQLKRVDIREIWVHEERDFTPWLAKNLHFLGDAIGLELVLESEEVSVGSFRADILAKDAQTNNWVLIENQLERTDHSHLGQIITYASGLKAATVIWIAERFADEHIAALDWLNSITDDSVRFFGLQIELWTIDTTMAPRFQVVSRPNSWIKKGRNYKDSLTLQTIIATGSHRERIKQAMLMAMSGGKEITYQDIAEAASVGYSTVKKYAPIIREELATVNE